MSDAGIFVTGTDTDVGKTVITAAFVACLRKQGVDAVPMKPVQTGCRREGDRLVAPDVEFILRVSGLVNVLVDEDDLICPYRFEPACSPHLAAERDGTRIEIDRIQECYEELARKHELVVVEGAGGVLVPLDENKTMLDLMRKLALPVAVVSRPGLGTINHTLLSVGALAWADLRVLGVVFNAADNSAHSYIEEDNVKTVRKMGEVSVLGTMPFVNDIEGDNPEFAAVAEQALGLACVGIRGVCGL